MSDRFLADSHLILRLAQDAIAERGRFRLGLAGNGELPRLLTQVAERGLESSARFDRWEVFWCEERHVPAYHPHSCYRAAEQALLGRVPIRAEGIHRIRTEWPNPHESARCYEAELRRAFDLPAGEIPQFDLIVLGQRTAGTVITLSSAVLTTARAVLRLPDATVLPPLDALAGVRVMV
jgi:6-phosphogluconolactonase